MKKYGRILSTIIITSMALSVTGCGMVEKTPEAKKSEVVAVIGDKKITNEDVNEEAKSSIEMVKSSYGENYKESGKEYISQILQTALGQMVQDEVMMAEGKKLNMYPDEAKIDTESKKEFDNIKSQYGDQFAEQLKAAGHTEESFMDLIKDRYVINEIYKEMIKDATVTDEEVKKYYDDNIDTYKEKPGADLYHILVSVPEGATDEDFKKAEEECKKLKDRITNGEKFEDIADEVNPDGTKGKGGSLGFYEYDSTQLVTEFMDAAKKLKEGEVSDPVKTEFGYHLIMAKNVKTEEKTKSFDEVKDEVKTTAENAKKSEVFNTKMEEWKKDLKVKEYTDKLELVDDMFKDSSSSSEESSSSSSSSTDSSSSSSSSSQSSSSSGSSN